MRNFVIFFPSTNITVVFTSRRVKLARKVARMEKRNKHRILVRKHERT